MKRCFSIFAAALLSVAVAFGEGEQQFAEFSSCKLESGEAIQNCRVGYRTWGKLNEQRSNVVVLLTWFTGTSGQLAASIGAQKAIDPAKYFVVGIDALADGVSSSPSNSTAQPRMKFPQVTIADMVETQHRVLAETLKLNHVHAVIGSSMGGMQSFQWAVQYPEFMDVVIPIVGSSRPTAHDQLLWRAEKNAIFENVNFHDGDYKSPLIIPAVEDLHTLELQTPAKLNEQVSPAEFETKVKQMEQSDQFDTNDRVRQLEAIMTHDVAKKFGGDMSLAARAVKAKMLIIVANQDHMVNPEPALEFAKLLNLEPIRLESNCGHLAPGCSDEIVIPAVWKALGE